MSRPDLVQFLLDAIAAEWDTTNFDPQPDLYDQRDAERQSDGSRSLDHDLAENNAISVGDQPTVTQEPIGTSFDYQFTAPLNVRVEAVHESEAYSDQPGGVAGAADFASLVSETRRAIHTRRVNPTADDNVRHLRITDENAVSSGEKDYFRVDLTVEFFGYEDLP